MFEADLKFGETGEDVAWLRLLKSPTTKQVMDVRKDPYFQKIDVDFLQLTKDGVVNKVEVKTDRMAHKTGNFVFETKSNGNAGCLQRSEADYVLTVLATGETLTVVMDWLNVYISEHNLKEIPMGDNARGYLIPIKDLVAHKIAYLEKK